MGHSVAKEINSSSILNPSASTVAGPTTQQSLSLAVTPIQNDKVSLSKKSDTILNLKPILDNDASMFRRDEEIENDSLIGATIG